jgi:hypothetical protein
MGVAYKIMISDFPYQNSSFLWGFCSNMDLSDHAQILYTRGFEGEEFKEKSLSCRKLTVLEIFELKVNEFP